MASFTMDQQPFGWPYAGLKPSFYAVESATWKGSWLQVPNMAPTYEPFITDFESLLCDRNVLKSSGSIDGYRSSMSSSTAFSYGIASMVVLFFVLSIGLLMRNYYFMSRHSGKYDEELEDSEEERERNSYLQVHTHNKDFSSWIDDDDNCDPDMDDHSSSSSSNTNVGDDTAAAVKSDYLASLIL